MSSIQWEPNLVGSGTIGSDPRRLGQYYFELSPDYSTDVQVLALWVTGCNSPLLVWHLRQGATALAETVADTLDRDGLQAAITEKRHL
jgi:hypothetical protein